ALGALTSTPVVAAQSSGAPAAARIEPPTQATKARELAAPEGYSEEQRAHYFVDSPGSDFMVDILQQLNIDYLAINPGSSFRGLHESVVNYGENARPKILTCLHEEQAVAIAHGYAKAAGKPMAVACHGTVGLQHAAMAVYNAWCDYVPVVIIAGNHIDAPHRSGSVGWAHSAQDPVAIVRDFTKWDASPISLEDFSESLVRGYRIAMTPPRGPTVLVADADLQEAACREKPPIPNLTVPRPPQGDSNAVRETARLLLAAESPVIVADRHARTQTGVDSLVELAELLQASVLDEAGRMNFPSNHYLNHTFAPGSLMRSADFILALEVNDVWGLLYRNRDYADRKQEFIGSEKLKLVTIGTQDLFYKSNYQNFQRYIPSELAIAGDSEATLPSLIEAVRKEMTSAHKKKIGARKRAAMDLFGKGRSQALDDARYGWDSSPISMPRLCMELWHRIKDRDWSLVSQSHFQSFWPRKLWDFDKHHQYLGGSGGAGIGYGAPAAAGAALAFRDRGVLPVNIQSDGDLLYGPTALWTAAHHNLPLLSVMHNNGGYHQEFMHLQRMASRRRRGIESTAKIGNAFDDPSIDFAAMAKSMGVWSAGPICDPQELGPAIAKALDVIGQGEPALIDVICQPR
ncbi:MAG TPA: thiamine pyrophosphate-dependent enzyme, partial [Steroidobacteraceae bacterium]|nr:thiamine pyrophosphate-dependent enzyme [Steroidobacteraceae bacterium]